mmetsp:Transcript_20293/g.30377  ORF Transcript_20293/g.30377 Transcript_20293/m.30377 type:complete len:116 (+) Transcript_20293:1-348(+)
MDQQAPFPRDEALVDPRRDCEEELLRIRELLSHPMATAEEMRRRRSSPDAGGFWSNTGGGGGPGAGGGGGGGRFGVFGGLSDFNNIHNPGSNVPPNTGPGRGRPSVSMPPDLHFF